MRLNTFERWWIHHPLRRWSQRTLEARVWKGLGADLRGGRVLEIGCGRGDGLGLLREDFGAAVVHGLDLDERQLRRARRRQRLRTQQGLPLLQADACALPFADHSYDAVVSFNALHHVPDWSAALAECCRVLKPGGQLLLLESLRGFLEFPLSRLLMKHPPDRFDAAELVQASRDLGFTLRGQRSLAGCFHWLVAEAPPAAPRCLRQAS